MSESPDPTGVPPEAPTTLLLLHTLGQMPPSWQDVASGLPVDWRVMAPWVPGLKPTDRSGFSLDDAAGRLVGELEQRGVRRTHVLGQGLGAVVAVRMAAAHPALVDRLVLAGGLVTPPRLIMRAQLAALRRLPDDRLREQGLSRDRLGPALEALAELDLRGDLARVQSTTLVLVGEADRALQPAAKALARGIRGARLERLPGGRDLNTESPDALRTALLAFLAEES
jgi:3-oxoadipate enol-lactonase